jgi:hypothetical protein
MNVDPTLDQRALVKRAIDSGGSATTKRPYKRRWRCGKSGSADGWRSWRRSTKQKRRSPVVRADR